MASFSKIVEGLSLRFPMTAERRLALRFGMIGFLILILAFASISYYQWQARKRAMEEANRPLNTKNYIIPSVTVQPCAEGMVRNAKSNTCVKQKKFETTDVIRKVKQKIQQKLK